MMIIIGEDVNNWNHHKSLVTVSERKMRQPLWKPCHPSPHAGSGDSSAVVAAGSRKGTSFTGALRQRLGANSASQGGSLIKWTHSGLPLLPSF